MKTKHTVVIIDDHPIIHDGLRILLGGQPDLDLVSSAMSANEALGTLEESVPDLIIMDLSLGGSDGVYLLQKLRKLYPKLRILVYTMSEEKLFAERCGTAGANGYVMKTQAPAELKKAIRQVLAGTPYFTPETLERLKKRDAGRGSGTHTLIDTLSNRELDVFKLIGEGLDTVGISERLNISRNTVDTHRINIKNKLELTNGKALDRFAYEAIQKGTFPEK